MDNKQLIKGLSVVMIFLLVSVSFSSVVSAEIVKEENTLDKIINDLKTKLEDIETNDEVVAIFNKALIELEKINLVDNQVVEKIQRLIKIYSENPKSGIILVTGELTNISQFNLFQSWFLMSEHKLLDLIFVTNDLIFVIFFIWFFEILPLTMGLSFIFPLNLLNTICVGYTSVPPYIDIDAPANGWIFSTNPNEYREGEFYGQLEPIWIRVSPYRAHLYYPGIVRFSGINIGNFFLGVCNYININTSRP